MITVNPQKRHVGLTLFLRLQMQVLLEFGLEKLGKMQVLLEFGSYSRAVLFQGFTVFLSADSWQPRILADHKREGGGGGTFCFKG